MANWQYTARTASNEIKTGVITASDRAAAVKSLNDKRLFPLVVKEAGRKKGTLNIKIPGITGRIKAKDIVIMTRQLATMVGAGVPIVKSLRTLQEQTESAALRSVLGTVIGKVEDGSPLSEALGEHPKTFSVVYINMVKAGETGGILDQILDRLAFQVEKDAEIKGKVKGAMIYPAVITTITFAAFFFLMTVIVPKLQGIFDEFGSQLPAHTRILLSISNFLQNYSWLVILFLAGGVFMFVKLIRTPIGKKRWHKIVLKMPIFGTIVLKVNVARFARTFSSLASAGVPVLDSMTVTSQALNNVTIRQGIEGAIQKVREGEPISDSLEQAQIFPPIVPRMTAVGEETGQVDKVLTKIAEFYEKEVDRVIANLTSIIEPLLIIVLGGLVGIIISSVFGPISNLSNIVK